jgi:hypothetical protein
MGLVPNRAGYRVTKANFDNKSALRSSFIGSSNK